MSKSNESGEVFAPLTEQERRIAQALGANVVYPIVGGQPTVTDLIFGNVQIDRTRPIAVGDTEVGEV